MSINLMKNKRKHNEVEESKTVHSEDPDFRQINLNYYLAHLFILTSIQYHLLTKTRKN